LLIILGIYREIHLEIVSEIRCFFRKKQEKTSFFYQNIPKNIVFCCKIAQKSPKIVRKPRKNMVKICEIAPFMLSLHTIFCIKSD